MLLLGLTHTMIFAFFSSDRSTTSLNLHALSIIMIESCLNTNTVFAYLRYNILHSFVTLLLFLLSFSSHKEILTFFRGCFCYYSTVYWKNRANKQNTLLLRFINSFSLPKLQVYSLESYWCSDVSYFIRNQYTLYYDVS